MFKVVLKSSFPVEQNRNYAASMLISDFNKTRIILEHNNYRAYL